jgi:hypothetical protein
LKTKSLYIGLLLILFYACQQKHDPDLTKPSTMQSHENPEIQATLDSLKTGMIEFIEIGDPEYTKKDVEKCMSLIDRFLIDIDKSENKEDGMKMVKELTLQLNDLNNTCEGDLIETEQREQIAQIIILAGHLKGYNEINEDITEEWREW